MPRGVLAALLFVSLLVFLAWNAGQNGLAWGYIDPAAKIAPQDEAVYSHIALRMAHRGDWLTPHFLERFALFKPPLLYWASAVSVSGGGDNVLALRMPSLVAGAAVPALLFFFIGGPRGLLAALLLVSHPLWYTLARLNLTDALLSLWITLAAVSLWKQWRLGFSLATAAAILTKGLAGLTPLFILPVWLLIARQPLKRWLLPAAGSFVFAAPWFLYQFIVHPRWFWAEFVQVEILGYSLGAPPQTTHESQLLFYAKRLFFTDPLLCVLLLAAIAACWRARKDLQALLLTAWLVTVLGLALANSYRNVAYVLPAIPAMAWLASAYLPFPKGRHDWLAVAAILALIPIRLPASRELVPLPASTALQRYAALHRPNELVIVDVEDQFVGTTLNLPRVRYAFRQSEEPYRRYGLDFRSLGIVLTVDELQRRTELEPKFAVAQKEWNLNSLEATGTVILIQSDEDLAKLLQETQLDFLIPKRVNPIPANPHEPVELPGDLVFLLAR